MMVTENPDLTDEVTQEQETLDQEQGISPNAETGPTTHQLQAQISALEQSNRGLQSKIDTGLNAVRRDTAAWAQGQIDLLKGDIENQTYLAGLDEDQRLMVQGLQNYVDRKVPSTPQTSTDTAASTMAPTQQSLVEQWTPVIDYVESFGISRNDPRVQYAMVAAADNQVDTSKFTAFRDHVVKLRAQDLAMAGQPTQARQATIPTLQTGSPPVEGSGNVSAGSITTPDSARDAFLNRTIDRETYLEKMAGFGEPA
jgi:hypothetical protein